VVDPDERSSTIYSYIRYKTHPRVNLQADVTAPVWLRILRFPSSDAE